MKSRHNLINSDIRLLLGVGLIACADGDKSGGDNPDIGVDSGESSGDNPSDDDTVYTFLVSPYIQLVTESSIWILWETDSGHESTVEWGTSESLGNTASGTTDSEGIGILHKVQITGLDQGATIWYRVKTGGAFSDIYRTKTSPAQSEVNSFRIVAMSDMQRDDRNPTKYREVVEDGVLGYFNQHYGTDTSQELAMVLIPGDLVDNGWLYTDWLDDFFAQSQQLMGKVPFYPVTGNHEANTPLFFRYFELPDNGTVGYEEHWWWLDYGNVKIIGLDSNNAYRIQTQLDWLDDVLVDACNDDKIDFVIAQLHHPFKSEL